MKAGKRLQAYHDRVRSSLRRMSGCGVPQDGAAATEAAFDERRSQGPGHPRAPRSAVPRPSQWLGAVVGMAAVVALALAGCAGAMREPEPGKPLALAKETALVFGRIEVDEGGRPVAFGGWSGPSAEALFLRIDGEGEEASVSIGDDGRYYLLVPRGTYLLAQVSRRFDPRTAFRVPEGDDAYYLGTLRLDVTSESALLGRSYSLKGVRVTDEFDEARNALVQRFPAFKGSVAKSLLVHSDEIPGAAEAREQLRQKQQSQRLMWHIYNVLQTLSIRH